MLYWRKNIEYNIYITNEAKIQINKHINFLSRVSINAAIKLKKDIKEYLIILKHFPRIGKRLHYDNKLQKFHRKVVINKRYSLIYFVVKNNIYVDAILDARQNNIYYLF